jgi:alpha/beta superfamily hydrolase
MERGMNAASTSSEVEAFSETARVRSVDLTGPAGRLEALFNQGAPDAPYAALVCHPHPLYGGTLHNKVVYHAMKVLNDPAWGFRWPVLRFNFRGVGLSEGTHDGKAETGDVVAALDWLRNEIGRPIVLAGFSFGAATTLRICCSPQNEDKNVCALAALGLPTQANDLVYQYSFLSNASIPKLFLSGDRDLFASAAQLAEVVASAASPKQLVLIPGADHFFTGQLQAMQQALACWLMERFL